MNNESYKTPSGRLCPYPDMSDDDLDDFEKWAEKRDRESLESMKEFFAVLFFITIPFWIYVIFSIVDYIKSL